MLFSMTWAPRPGVTPEEERQVLKLLGRWTPPEGLKFLSFYEFADGNGGMALAEVATAEDLLKATAPWASTLQYTIRAIVPMDQAGPIMGEAHAWRDSQS